MSPSSSSLWLSKASSSSFSPGVGEVGRDRNDGGGELGIGCGALDALFEDPETMFP
jgi:hypothetical protein